MNTQTMTCKASVWPHRHRNEGYGPLDLRISYRNQPPVAQSWPRGISLLAWLEQPDERTNLTIMRVKFKFCGVWKLWHRIRLRRIKKDRGISIYLKSRITNSLDHPVPVGRYDGTCKYTSHWCLYTFQAVSLRVKPEESRIIVP